MRKDYWTILKEDILQNRQLMFAVIFTGVLCFGFTITNFSIGVDDSARWYYLYSASQGSMIQQGRLMHVLVNKITRCVQFIPFFTDFVGAALYTFSALCFCALFQFITERRLSFGALASFACIYISSSVIAEKYIYHLDVIVTMLSYVLSAVAMMYAFRFVKEKKWTMFAMAAVALMGAIASYESFVFLYFCCVFVVFILEICINKDNKSFRDILLEGIGYALILIVAVVAYYGLVYVIQHITGQNDIFIRYNYWKESGLGIMGTFVKLTREFIEFFRVAISDRYLPILMFCLFSVVGGVLSVIYAVRRRNVWVPVCYAALFVGNFFIHYMACGFMTRAAQTFCLFVGFVILLLVEFIGNKRCLKQLAAMAVVLLVFVQSADMNRWFYNDYVRYKKETFVIDTVATELVGKCDISKPVVFTNNPEHAYLNTALYAGRQVNGNSMIYWSVYAWQDPTQPFVTEIFKMHGYDFVISPTEEQNLKAHEAAETMPAWPKEGYMQELDDCIVVNFG